MPTKMETDRTCDGIGGCFCLYSSTAYDIKTLWKSGGRADIELMNLFAVLKRPSECKKMVI